jgi:hypothetical protein
VGLAIPGIYWWFISWTIYNNEDQVEKSDYRFFWSNGEGDYKYVLEFPIRITTNRVFQIYPNDCIKRIVINHEPYKGLSWDLCNYRNGIRLDLGNYLKLWNNIIQVDVAETGNSRAFIIKPSEFDQVRLRSFLFLGLSLFLLLYYYFTGWFVFDTKKKHYLFWIIVGIMFGLALVYTIKADYFKWSHDLTGHLDYMKLLLRGEWLPASDQCWQCYHPNIYYWISEVVYRFGAWIGWADPFELMRWFTYMGWRVGVMYAFRLLYMLFVKKHNSYWIFITAAILFAFWPTQFYYGSRITNDVWHYMLSYIGLYYWLMARSAYQNNDDWALKSNTLIGTLLLVVWLYIKSNSIIWLPLVWLWFVARMFVGSLWSNIKLWKWMIIRLWFIIIIGMLWAVWMSSMKGAHGIVDNADRLNAGNSVAYVPVYEAFSSFHTNQFISYLAMRNGEDDTERRSFRNFLIKTSVTGEMGVTMPKNVPYFPYFMISSLLFFALLLIRIFSNRRIDLFMLLGFGLPVLAMMIYRVIYPLAASMHYRYILPHLLFIIYYSVERLLSKESFKERKVIDWLHILIISTFVIFSILFSIPPYF